MSTETSQTETPHAVELFQQDGKSAGIFYCSKCRRLASSRENADQCCNPFLCKTCGQDTGHKYHYECWECRKNRFAAEELAKLDSAEKLEAWDGWVYYEPCYSQREGYSESVADLIGALEDNGIPEADWPGYVFVCSSWPVQLNLDDILESATEEAFEDAMDQLKDVDELKVAIDAFNKANESVLTYNPDFKRAVRVRPKKEEPESHAEAIPA